MRRRPHAGTARGRERLRGNCGPAAGARPIPHIQQQGGGGMGRAPRLLGVQPEAADAAAGAWPLAAGDEWQRKPVPRAEG